MGYPSTFHQSYGPLLYASMNGSGSLKLTCFSLVSVALLALSPLAQENPRSLYDGDSLVFEAARLIKPLEETNAALAYALAPLLIQEVKGTNSVTPSLREIFFWFGSTHLHGRENPQVSYWWQIEAEEISPGARRTINPDGKQKSSLLQGVRLTLGDSGHPEIYEILTDPSAIAQIYVAQSVEAAARAQFGPALLGRRFAIEAGLAAAPQVVVPRVIADAPAVMGPILYLRAGTHEVATLICRCMDSQARHLAGTGHYTLIATNPPAAITDQTRRLDEVLRYPRPLAFGTNTAR